MTRRPASYVDAVRIAVAVMAVLLACTGLTACGPGGDVGTMVALLPHDTTTQTWEWTSECRVGPLAGAGCDSAGPHLGHAQLAGNEWNLGGTGDAGSVAMALDAEGSLHVDGRFSATPPCTDERCIAPQANTWVRGFPSVLYGIDQCHADTSPPRAGVLALPTKVASLPSTIVGTTTYDVDSTNVTHDVAYDLWLNPSGTTTPCQTDGTLEVMVWTDHDARAILPDSLQVGRASIPYAVGGTARPAADAWTVYATNVYGDGHTAPWGGTVWLVLDPDQTVAHGTVGVDLRAALASVGSLLENTYGWSNFATTYWLDTIAFGIEFGPRDADPYSAAPTQFGFDLSSYCLGLGTEVASTNC